MSTATAVEDPRQYLILSVGQSLTDAVSIAKYRPARSSMTNMTQPELQFGMVEAGYTVIDLVTKWKVAIPIVGLSRLS